MTRSRKTAPSLPLLISLALLLAGGYACNRPAPRGTPGEAINPFIDPYQESLSNSAPIPLATSDGDFTLTPVAAYTVSARVVSAKSYSRGWESSLSPIDLALAWGELARMESDETISYSQRGRWYYYRYSPDCPFSNDYIINHSANCHIIPASDNIGLALRRIRRHDLVSIQGYLVNIRGRKDGRSYWWNTSTTRSDTGNGSCEILYAEAIQVNDTIYR